VGRVLVSRTGEVGSTVCKGERLQIYAHVDTRKVFFHQDSRSVAMEVGIRNGVCNNSATEWKSPENGRILSVRPLIHQVLMLGLCSCVGWRVCCIKVYL